MKCILFTLLKDDSDTDEAPLVALSLNQAELPILSDYQCSMIFEIYSRSRIDPHINICAGGNGKDTCQVLYILNITGIKNRLKSKTVKIQFPAVSKFFMRKKILLLKNGLVRPMFFFYTIQTYIHKKNKTFCSSQVFTRTCEID